MKRKTAPNGRRDPHGGKAAGGVPRGGSAPAERVYGLAAALAAFERRPEAVLSIAHTSEVRKSLAPLLREAARRRIAYREVVDAELALMADSIHHEGVCLLARPRPHASLEDLLERVEAGGLLLALDDVQNPHNVGAMLRSAAYFGARGLIVVESQRSKLSAAARRVAEGGAEHVPVALVAALAPALRELSAGGLGVIGADARARMPLAELRWPERAVLVVGHERKGLLPETRAACKILTRIAGSGVVDSLNVSVAAGVLMASFAEHHGADS